jgi:hypothetical protein
MIEWRRKNQKGRRLRERFVYWMVYAEGPYKTKHAEAN